MKRRLALVLLLVSRTSYADEVQTIPPGEDVIVVVRKGDVAPFTGQLFDNATSVRWALWLQQYKQLLPIHDAHTRAVCQADADHAKALSTIEAQRTQTVHDDLLARLQKSEKQNAELEHPPWYESGWFHYGLGIGTATAILFLGEMAVRAVH